MNRIYKYVLHVDDTQVIKLPKRAEIKSVCTQYNRPVLYALVDPLETETEEITIKMFGTGHEIDRVDNLQFLGTILLHEDALVLHVFKVIE